MPYDRRVTFVPWSGAVGAARWPAQAPSVRGVARPGAEFQIGLSAEGFQQSTYAVGPNVIGRGGGRAVSDIEATIAKVRAGATFSGLTPEERLDYEHRGLRGEAGKSNATISVRVSSTGSLGLSVVPVIESLRRMAPLPMTTWTIETPVGSVTVAGSPSRVDDPANTGATFWEFRYDRPVVSAAPPPDGVIFDGAPVSLTWAGAGAGDFDAWAEVVRDESSLVGIAVGGEAAARREVALRTRWSPRVTGQMLCRHEGDLYSVEEVREEGRRRDLLLSLSAPITDA